MPLSNVQIEISGMCNARCPYCVTGQNNRKHKKTGSFIKIEEFKYVIELLKQKSIIDESSMISLYNYGEPLLHPQFVKIIEILEDWKYQYDISTNASIALSEDIIKKMKHLKKLQFSVCGMSQESYDKIHGFNVKIIMQNISAMVEMIHKYNPDTECILKLQMYKFNEHEFQDALNYSKKNNMTVIPLHAIFANLEQQMEMISEYKMNNNYFENDDLILDYLPEVLNNVTPACIEHEGLVIDEDLNVALCCMVTKEMPQYYWKKLEDISLEEIEKRITYDYCMKCINSGTSSSICKTPSYNKYLLNQIKKILNLNNKRIIVVGNDGITNSFMLFFGQQYVTEKILKINQIKEEAFYILASKNWWRDLDILNDNGKMEGKDYLIYNTYLR